MTLDALFRSIVAMVGATAFGCLLLGPCGARAASGAELAAGDPATRETAEGGAPPSVEADPYERQAPTQGAVAQIGPGGSSDMPPSASESTAAASGPAEAASQTGLPPGHAPTASSEGSREAPSLGPRPIEPVSALQTRPAELGVDVGEPGPSGVEIGGWVLFGVGGASFVAGVVTGLLALEQSRQLDAGCVEARCPPELHSGVDAFYAYRTTSTAALAAAGALVIPGVALLLAAPGTDSSSPEPALAASRLRPRVAPPRALRLILRPMGVDLAAVL